MTINFYYSDGCRKALTIERVLGSDNRGQDIVQTLFQSVSDIVQEGGGGTITRRA